MFDLHTLGHALIVLLAVLLAWFTQKRRYACAMRKLVEIAEFRRERLAEVVSDHNAAVADLMYTERRMLKAEHERDTLREQFMQAAPQTYEKLFPIIVPRLTADMATITESPE